MEHIKSALLVDSNDIDNFINHRLLETHGVTNIISFHDPESALNYLKDTNVIYHLIIVDFDAPEINGPEFIQRFYEAGLEKKQGEIYALSSSAIPVKKNRSENKNIKRLCKPLTIDQLVQS